MSKPGEADQGVATFLMVGLLALLAYGIWYLFREQIIDFVRFVRVGQLYLIGFFTDRVAMPDGSTVTPAQLYEWLASSKADNLTWGQLSLVSTTIVPQFLRWPAVVLLLAMGFAGYKFSPRRKLRQNFNLEDLIKVQATAWPVITPITKLNPATGPQRAPGDTL
ncbi:MAG TPA: hypothetical protein PKW15_07405, partial [Alphaproteobacteria bacterium]|nr:hypothetical protein [Alphaproteobacteria bacterium]